MPEMVPCLNRSRARAPRVGSSGRRQTLSGAAVPSGRRSLQRWSRLGLVGLGSGFHALVSFRQCPELTRELGAIDEVWLVVVWATVENVQTLAGAAKLRRQPDAVAVLRYNDVPELAREVAAIYEMWPVVVGAAVENVQASGTRSSNLSMGSPCNTRIRTS
jgi:hypothetical protein